MSSVASIFRQNNPYETFVKQLVQIESRTKVQLQARKGAESERKSAIGAISSSISRFTNKIKELQSPLNNSFHPLTASSSDNSVVRVTSSDGAKQPSAHNITVDRLATHDIVLSGLMDGDGDDLASFGNGSIEVTVGDRTEYIEIGVTYEDDELGTVQKTNREILQAFADAVSETFDGTARASVFQVNSEQVQFSVQSLETGSEHQIGFDNGSGVLAELTDGMAHLTPVEELDALFTIDGVIFTRGQNEVGDAVEGVTLELRKATGEQETVTIRRDVNKARSAVNGFISAFNDVNKTIRDRTFLDTDNDRRGALQNMRSIRNLTYNLRQTGLLPLESAGEEELKRLTEIGIGFRKNGEMYLEDSALLNEMLEQKPGEVEKLFTLDDSVISQMKAEAEAYTKSNGLLKSMEEGIDQTIDRLDRRIAAQDRYLEQYEERQREIFNNLQLIIDQGDAQFQQIMSFRTRMGF